ncbi:MAG TPA: GntR family transcriptional regulator [Thermoanaerobacterales bacterium]|nr:GntR family transcriptional regulator [Thermoanaerobacterales bacterium]
MFEKSYKPLYKQLKEKIIQDISNQIYKPGDKIPSQNELAKLYDVSRVTVKQALNELIYSGILSAQKGKGTFVKDLPFDKYSNNRLGGFTESIEKIGYKAYTKVVSVTFIDANKYLAGKLQVEIGDPIIHLKRIRMINDVPMSLENSYLNKALINNIEFTKEFLENKSLYRLLKEQAKIDFSYAEEKINAVLCDEEASELLKISKDEPILFIKRKTYTKDNLPIEFCENYVRSDVYNIVIRFNKE